MRKLLPLLLVVLAPMAMLYPLWSNPVSAGEDDVIYYYPLRKMVAQQVREGHLPLFNEREAGGVPLLADPQSAVMYPPTWLFVAIPDAKLAYSLSVFLAFSIAGAGAYLYLRRLGLRKGSSAFGAMAFMFCGFMVGHRVHLSVIHTACYLPWGLLGIEMLRRFPGEAKPPRGRLRIIALLTMAVYLALTAGHWPSFLHLGVIWSAYLLLRGRPLAGAALTAGAAMALALALAGPQIVATADMMAAATRQRIGFAMAGENSFFPTSAMLALFPMIQGSRTPNFFPQAWWGSWHLCEMLGYAGLLTLALALAALWKIYRKPRASRPGLPPDEELVVAGYRPLVRAWTWLALGAGLWMLGYYLPTYRLVHMLPVLGVVRCPARMVLAVDMALATLGAIMVDAVAATWQRGQTAALAKAAKTAALRVLPVLMAATLALLGVLGLLMKVSWLPSNLFFVGTGDDALAAARPSNPAVWVQLLLLAATAGAVWFWLRSPRRRTGALVAMLLLDLFFVTRFVDVPGDPKSAPDPDVSPAAAWFKDRGLLHSGRIYALGEKYYARPNELLLPKTCESLGLSTLASYGPWQSPRHAQLLGLNICGDNRDWESLVRRNYLLGLCDVRYLVTTEGSEYETVIRSTDILPEAPPDGPNVLAPGWTYSHAATSGEAIRLSTPFMWLWSMASQPVPLKPGGTYRIALDARGPDGGAANFLRADILETGSGSAYRQPERWGLTAAAEQITPAWRHFEWVFTLPPTIEGQLTFRVFTMSERPIEVKSISLRESHSDAPVFHGSNALFATRAKLSPGEKVYKKVATLPPLHPVNPLGQPNPPVVIYENLLHPEFLKARGLGVLTPEEIETLKWAPRSFSQRMFSQPPDIGLHPGEHDFFRMFFCISAPSAGVYILVVAAGLFPRRTTGKRKEQ